MSYPPVTYVAIGASDAYGVGADDPATENWPAVLSAWLPPGSKLVNLGVPGITLHRALAVEMPVALDALSRTAQHPGCSGPGRSLRQRCALITVWLAVNDVAAGVSLPAYTADLQTLLGALQTRTHALVLVGNLPNLALLPAFRGYDTHRINALVMEWNSAIAAIVWRNGAILVDLYAHWRELAAHPGYLSADGLHPTTAGYRRLAHLFWQKVPR